MWRSPEATGECGEVTGARARSSAVQRHDKGGGVVPTQVRGVGILVERELGVRASPDVRVEQQDEGRQETHIAPASIRLGVADMAVTRREGVSRRS
jgi:hypothetical protein